MADTDPTGFVKIYDEEDSMPAGTSGIHARKVYEFSPPKSYPTGGFDLDLANNCGMTGVELDVHLHPKTADSTKIDKYNYSTKKMIIRNRSDRSEVSNGTDLSGIDVARLVVIATVNK